MHIKWTGGPYTARGYNEEGFPVYHIRFTFDSQGYHVWAYDKTGRNGVHAGQFELMRDAKQWCEMHYATGAGE